MYSGARAAAVRRAVCDDEVSVGGDLAHGRRVRQSVQRAAALSPDEDRVLLGAAQVRRPEDGALADSGVGIRLDGHLVRPAPRGIRARRLRRRAGAGAGTAAAASSSPPPPVPALPADAPPAPPPRPPARRSARTCPSAASTAPGRSGAASRSAAGAARRATVPVLPPDAPPPALPPHAATSGLAGSARRRRSSHRPRRSRRPNHRRLPPTSRPSCPCCCLPCRSRLHRQCLFRFRRAPSRRIRQRAEGPRPASTSTDALFSWMCSSVKGDDGSRPAVAYLRATGPRKRRAAPRAGQSVWRLSTGQAMLGSPGSS